jgi:hypothetical protein
LGDGGGRTRGAWERELKKKVGRAGSVSWVVVESIEIRREVGQCGGDWRRATKEVAVRRRWRLRKKIR